MVLLMKFRQLRPGCRRLCNLSWIYRTNASIRQELADLRKPLDHRYAQAKTTNSTDVNGTFEYFGARSARPYTYNHKNGEFTGSTHWQVGTVHSQDKTNQRLKSHTREIPIHSAIERYFQARKQLQSSGGCGTRSRLKTRDGAILVEQGGWMNVNKRSKYIAVR